MNGMRNIFTADSRKGWSGKSVLIAALAAIAIPVFAAPSLAGEREDHDRGQRYQRDNWRERDNWRDRDFSRERDSNRDRTRTDVRIDINLGHHEPVYRQRVTRVWVEPVYRTVTDRVWVEPVYRSECQPVWIDAVVRDECQRVWVPDRWQVREVVHGFGRGRYVTRERVPIERGHYEDQHRQVVVAPGHWENVERRVLVCEGHWETVTRQELVCAGHWEERSVAVDDCSVSPFDVFAGLVIRK